MPAAIVSSIAGRPSCVAGILMNRFGRSTSACSRLASSIVASCRARGSGRPRARPSRRARSRRLVPRRAQDVAGVADVLDGEREEDLLGLGLGLEHLAELLVVGVALGDRGLEDRRVGRDAGDAVARRAPRGRRPGRTGARGSRSRRSGRGRRAAGGGCRAWSLLRGEPRVLVVFVEDAKRARPQVGYPRDSAGNGRRVSESARRGELAQPGGDGLLVAPRLAPPGGARRRSR